MRRSLATIAAVSMLASGPAFATAIVTDYNDNRSTPRDLMQSYYNALERKEFARAWTYWGEDDKPAASFEDFEDQFSAIESVELVIGDIQSEGAAGSVFHNIPLAVRINLDDGSHLTETGCVVARLANPQIQGVPFDPMHIVSADLAETDSAPADAVPDSCL